MQQDLPAKGPLGSLRGLFEGLTFEKLAVNCGLYAAIVIIFVVFALINPNFLTANNMVNVFEQSAYFLVCAVGITFVLISGSNDLSVGSQVAFSSVIGTLYLAETANIVGSMALMLGLGVLIGLTNGLFVVVIGLPPFIGTISTSYVVRGIVAYMTEQQTVVGIPRSYINFFWARSFGISNSTWCALVVVAIGIYVLKFTAYGRRVQACGANPTACKVMGINVTLVKISTYVISACLAAIAAILIMTRQSAARAGTAEILHMDCIAAAVIGGTSLKGGHGSLVGTMIGVFFISMIRSGLNGMGVNYFWQLVFTGAITLFAAILDSYKSRINA